MTAPITVPEGYNPRSYSRAYHEALERGARRAVLLRARRLSKSTDLVTAVARAAVQHVGTHFIFAPTYAQGRKVFWDGTTHDGRRLLLGYLPRVLIASVSEAEMQVVLKNGSVIQIIGGEQVDRIRGTNPLTVAFDEYATFDSAACWDILRPVLAENGGLALFAFTPRGRNHAWQLWEMATKNPEWFTQRLTVSEARRDAPGEDGAPVIRPEVIDADRLEGMPESLVQQEYYCSFAAAVSGAVYGPEMAALEAEGRIREVPHTPGTRCTTAWDIGRGVTAILIVQQSYETVKIIDYVELLNDDLAAAVKALQAKPYVYAEHIGPHDLKAEEWGGGRSRLASARRLGVGFRVLPRLSVDEGIHAARLLLPRCVFDERRTTGLVAALSHYERAFDEEKKIFAVKPRADWASHGADAFRYLALGLRELRGEDDGRPRPTTFATTTLTSWTTGGPR